MGARVLYIEDNLDNLVLVRRILRAEGFELFEATSAAVGIALAQSVLPEIILMDINMPEMDGLQATRILREIPELHPVPIIALTANVMHDILARALDSGCDGYIEKPIKIDTFAEDILAYVAQGRRQRVE